MAPLEHLDDIGKLDVLLGRAGNRIECKEDVWEKYR
jgi:hypothetical protein